MTSLFVLFFITLLISVNLCHSQSSVSVTYFEPGTNCTQAAKERPGWVRTTRCYPQSNPDLCQGRPECGISLKCDPTTITFQYWFSAKDECLRGNPETTVKYLSGMCLSSKEGFMFKNYESVMSCN